MPAVLLLQTLEHGAYYAGKLDTTPAVARWHAGKRRFVLSDFSFGQQRVRSIPHVEDGGAGERFAPLSRTNPKKSYEVSDYSFETVS